MTFSPIKLTQLSVILILNHINNFIDPTKIFMTLLKSKIFQSNYSRYCVRLLDFCLLQYFTAICHMSNVMILFVVSSFLTLYLFFF